MNRLGILITAMLVLTVIYFLATVVFKPSQPQVVVVKPSGAQNNPQNPQAREEPRSPPQMPVGEPPPCVKHVYLKVGSVSLCADMIHSMVKTDGHIQVDFQGGIIHGIFMFASAPTCVVTTTPQGVHIPCRAQVLIPTKS